MKRNKDYILKTIAGVSYVLPYGQSVADLRRGVELNETGVVLWNMLKDELTRKAVLDKFLAHIKFNGSDEEKFNIQNDVDLFFEQLICMGIIEESVLEKKEESGKYLKIGDIFIKFEGYLQAMSADFEAFEVKESSVHNVDMTIQIHCYKPDKHNNGNILIRNEELIIAERVEDYLVIFPESEYIYEANIKKDGTKAEFFCVPSDTDELRYDLFHAIRLAYLYHAQQCGMYALHSASILYKDKIWLFSGSSGTGKSTHTGLWKEFFGTPVINGDLNLISITENGPVVYGMPWCGTSGIYDVKSYPLGGIILLKQHKEDIIIELTEDKKALYVMQRLISPNWTEAQLTQNLEFTEKLAKGVYVGRLLCTKELNAAYVMKQKIDSL